MSTKAEILRRAKAQIDLMREDERMAAQEREEEHEAMRLAAMLTANESVVEAVRDSRVDLEKLAEIVTNAVKGLKMEAPVVNVPKAEAPKVTVNVPEVKVPDIKVNIPPIKIPKITVPKVTIPPVKMPKIPAPIVNLPDRMAVFLDDVSMSKPVPVIQVDPKGNFVGQQMITGGGGGRAKAVEAAKLTKKLEYSGTLLTYLGEATPGSATSDPTWRVAKYTYDGSNNLTDVQYADGNELFDNVWDDRASLSYS